MSLWHTFLIMGNLVGLIDADKKEDNLRYALHFIALFLCILTLCEKVYHDFSF